MKNAAILLLTVALIIAGLLGYRQTATANLRVKELEGKLAARTASEALNLQAKCAKQAAEAFRQFGWDKSEKSRFISHYNRRDGRCYVKATVLSDFPDVVSGEATYPYWERLMDAFEFKTYGEYGEQVNLGKPGGPITGRVLSCRVTLATDDVKECHSEEEFHTLVRPYMER
jgi:hypothetical protein